MADIFISYSAKDRHDAEELRQKLSSSGFSIWIDQSGIEVATSWSGEIVDAIEECKAFIVLLSEASVSSKNVMREVALAFERNKKILPLDIEPVVLRHDLAYHLAGIHRAPVTNIDAVLRAIGKLGIEATKAAPSDSIRPAIDSRKSLMILPFEDLSPTGDNGWFADGIVSELTGALANVRALRLVDWNTSKELRTRKVPTATLAKELDVRYFLEGQVRKAADQIKIMVSLLDFQTGDHLWQDSHKGTMENVFDIQEEVARKVAEALKIHLAAGKEVKFLDQGTENPEAYELFLKADESFSHRTREAYRKALFQLSEAIKLDPAYANALAFKAYVLTALYRAHDPDKKLLREAEKLAKDALKIKPDLPDAYEALSHIEQILGDKAN